MTKHMTGTRKEWLAARLELLAAEKELTRRSDELARRRRELPWVRVDKEYRFETDKGSATLADLFGGRSQLLVYHFMFGPDYTAGCPSCSAIADGFDGFVVHLANHDVTLSAVSRAPLAKLQAQAADGVDVSLGVLARQRLQLRLQRLLHRGATARGVRRIQLRARRPRAGREAGSRRRGACRLRGHDRNRRGHVRAREAGHERVRARGRRRLPHLFHLCARTGRPLGHVPVARPRAQGAQRDGRLVAPARRVRQAMSAMSMPGQTWLGAAASFLVMWIVMMVAMMLPSLVPTLRRYHKAGLGRLTALVGVGYFAVWTVFGMVAYLLGVALPRATPIAIGVVVLMAGFLQFTAWKARHLACCREARARGRSAWQHGLSLGLHCSQCNVGLMAILLVIGVMDLRAMAAVAVAITVERLAPAGERIARATGAIALGAGSVLIARAAGLG